MRVRIAALCVALAGVAAAGCSDPAQAGGSLEERKLPMRFSWVACQPDCRGWIGAVGIVTADTPKDFDEFARGRQLAGATVVLDFQRRLGQRRHRARPALAQARADDHGRHHDRDRTPAGRRVSIAPEAWCESMCVFLLLAGNTRYVPDAARVRVHQIWMGDRAEDARAASYTAQDLMIVERDIGRLAKYTFDMGGTGDLLSLSLSVPPWEDLHQLSRQELRLTNLVTTGLIADLLPPGEPGRAMADAKQPIGKPLQDRHASDTADRRRNRSSRPRPPRPHCRPAASPPRRSAAISADL